MENELAQSVGRKVDLVTEGALSPYLRETILKTTSPSMKKRDDGVYLRHILDALSTIESYLDSVTESQFYRTKLIQDGLIRQLEIIEAKRQRGTLCFALQI
ncbi:MAG: hypothetical protein ACRD1R_05610 [Acidobacteriota bacterium]